MAKQDFRTREDIRSLLHFLAGLPLLETLLLSSTQLSESLNVAATFRRITLPHLRKVLFAHGSLPFTGLLLRCLDIPPSQPLATMFTVQCVDYDYHEVYAPMTNLPVLGPTWDQTVQAASMAMIDFAPWSWTVTVVADKREVYLAGLYGSFEDAQGVLTDLVSQVSELWLELDEYTGDKEDRSKVVSTLAPPWLLRNATNAKKIFMHSYLDADIFNALTSVLAANVQFPAMLEECHVLLDESYRAKFDSEDAEAFFKSLNIAAIAKAPIFHLYYPRVDNLEQWKEKLLSNGVDIMRTVVMHGHADYPTIPLSSAFSEPCARAWERVTYH